MLPVTVYQEQNLLSAVLKTLGLRCTIPTCAHKMFIYEICSKTVYNSFLCNSLIVHNYFPVDQNLSADGRVILK